MNSLDEILVLSDHRKPVFNRVIADCCVRSGAEIEVEDMNCFMTVLHDRSSQRDRELSVNKKSSGH